MASQPEANQSRSNTLSIWCAVIGGVVAGGFGLIQFGTENGLLSAFAGVGIGLLFARFIRLAKLLIVPVAVLAAMAFVLNDRIEDVFGVNILGPDEDNATLEEEFAPIEALNAPDAIVSARIHHGRLEIEYGPPVDMSRLEQVYVISDAPNGFENLYLVFSADSTAIEAPKGSQIELEYIVSRLLVSELRSIGINQARLIRTRTLRPDHKTDVELVMEQRWAAHRNNNPFLDWE